MVRKTLIVAPHMDDEVLGCGGLIQSLSDVTVAFVTGRRTKTDVRISNGRRIEYENEERMFEMEVVAAALGHKVAPLGFPVHKLDEVPMSEIISKLEDLVTQGEYETVLIPGPSNDADHVITRHACNALIRPHFFAGTVLEYWTWGLPGPFDPVVLHRLTTAELGLKMQAMATYRTQIAAGGVEDDLYPYSMESVKAYAAAAGRLCHAKYAEAYTPRRIVR